MEDGHRAAARLYQAWFTGLVLTLVTRRGAAAAADLVFRVFRRQHLATFLPGLEKLGVARLPPAVAAAQYHYLSNRIGGVRVEYMKESDGKAWIRYPPPRWAWQGPAICAVPGEVSRAMLWGWHAHNGVALGEKRLGFVCTKQTVDAQDGLEGYFLVHDRALAPEERLRFAPGETAPPFDPAAAPILPEAAWPADRLAKARRNYAMEYARTALPALAAACGPSEAEHLGGTASYLVGMQLGPTLMEDLSIADGGAAGFAEFFRRMAEAQGDSVTVETTADGSIIRQRGWRLMAGVDDLDDAVACAIWNRIWEGCLASHDRRLNWRLLSRGEDGFEWQLSPSPASGKGISLATRRFSF
jgi:hypothetical protein